jgi:hypothetical protein
MVEYNELLHTHPDLPEYLLSLMPHYISMNGQLHSDHSLGNAQRLYLVILKEPVIHAERYFYKPAVLALHALIQVKPEEDRKAFIAERRELLAEMIEVNQLLTSLRYED